MLFIINNDVLFYYYLIFINNHMGNNITNCNMCDQETMHEYRIQPKAPMIMEKFNKTLGDQPNQEYAVPIDNTFQLNQQIKSIIENQSKQKQFKFDEKYVGKVLPSYKIQQSKAVYLGQWKQGFPHGKGKVFYENGSYFQGEFQMGKATCSDGLFVYPQAKAYYRGNIYQNRANGYGKIVYQNKKLIYQGYWADDVPQGQGEQLYFDGSRYIGLFKNGKKHGRGKYYWADNSQYQGEFKDGYMQGKGMQKLSNGQVYDGKFIKNKKVGYGKLVTEIGTYEGYFFNDKKEGQGKFTWNDHKIYIGSFKDGKLHGNGRMIFPNGQESEGEWENGININILKITHRTLSVNQNQIQLPNQQKMI